MPTPCKWVSYQVGRRQHGISLCSQYNLFLTLTAGLSGKREQRSFSHTNPPAASPGSWMPLPGPASHLPALGCCFGYPRESQMALLPVVRWYHLWFTPWPEMATKRMQEDLFSRPLLQLLTQKAFYITKWEAQNYFEDFLPARNQKNPQH